MMTRVADLGKVCCTIFSYKASKIF